MRVNTILLTAASLILAVSASGAENALPDDAVVVEAPVTDAVEVVVPRGQALATVRYRCPSQDKTGRGKHDKKCDKSSEDTKQDTFSCFFHNKSGHEHDDKDNDVHECTYSVSNGNCKTTYNTKCPTQAPVLAKRHWKGSDILHDRQFKPKMKMHRRLQHHH